MVQTPKRNDDGKWVVVDESDEGNDEHYFDTEFYAYRFYHDRRNEEIKREIACMHG